MHNFRPLSCIGKRHTHVHPPDIQAMAAPIQQNWITFGQDASEATEIASHATNLCKFSPGHVYKKSSAKRWSQNKLRSAALDRIQPKSATSSTHPSRFLCHKEGVSLIWRKISRTRSLFLPFKSTFRDWMNPYQLCRFPITCPGTPCHKKKRLLSRARCLAFTTSPGSLYTKIAS